MRASHNYNSFLGLQIFQSLVLCLLILILAIHSCHLISCVLLPSYIIQNVLFFWKTHVWFLYYHLSLECNMQLLATYMGSHFHAQSRQHQFLFVDVHFSPLDKVDPMWAINVSVICLCEYERSHIIIHYNSRML